MSRNNVSPRSTTSSLVEMSTSRRRVKELSSLDSVSKRMMSTKSVAEVEVEEVAVGTVVATVEAIVDNAVAAVVAEVERSLMKKISLHSAPEPLDSVSSLTKAASKVNCKSLDHSQAYRCEVE